MSPAALWAHSHRDGGLFDWFSETIVGIITLGVVGAGVALGFVYWYFASRPNVVVCPKFVGTFTSVEVRNHGRTAARDFRIRCPQLKFRDEDDSLDQKFDRVQPQQSFEYFVGVGHELVDDEPYCFEVSYRRWLCFGRTDHDVQVDFGSFRNVLTASEQPNKFTKAVEDLTNRADELLQMLVAERDRAMSDNEE